METVPVPMWVPACVWDGGPGMCVGSGGHVQGAVRLGKVVVLLAQALGHDLPGPDSGVQLGLCVPHCRHGKTILGTSCLSTRSRTCTASVRWIPRGAAPGPAWMPS